MLIKKCSHCKENVVTYYKIIRVTLDVNGRERDEVKKLLCEECADAQGVT